MDSISRADPFEASAASQTRRLLRDADGHSLASTVNNSIMDAKKVKKENRSEIIRKAWGA
jgi:hypothetical protein